VHRVGRTARGGASGLALSLVAIGSAEERRASRIGKARQRAGGELRPFAFDAGGVAALRYRVDDMLGTIGRRAVRDARSTALRQELINSERLKSHFEDNPRELALLKHNAPVAKSQVCVVVVVADALMCFFVWSRC
jgi:ATP-dependent RNA helicase DDX56/DBP9